MEIWKIVDNYPNYLVSNTGCIKSINHFVEHKNGRHRIQKGRVLKPSKCRKGYLRIKLKNNQGFRNFAVHRLVAKAFILNTENKPQVNHINGVKSDNRVENLEWCTNQENQIHAVKTKLIVAKRGVDSHKAKLNSKDIKNIALLRERGYSVKNIALKFKISKVSIYNLINSKTYN